MADLNSDKTVRATNTNDRSAGLNSISDNNANSDLSSSDNVTTNYDNSSTSTDTSQSVILESSQWPVEAASYTILGKIGRGAFATVYKAYFTNASHQQIPCAIKVINLEHVDTNFVDIRQEVQTMRLSRNKNILACHTSFIHHTNLWLVTQLMDKGSSLHCLKTARILYNPLNREQNILQAQNDPTGNRKIPTKTMADVNFEQHITYILHETIVGLQYIHENGKIHRDIKGGNILLSANAHVRIADFGVSGWLTHAGSQRENTRTFVGTPCWMAPEVMEQIHGYDTKADIWSLGITALELAKGHAPYSKYPPMKVLLLTIQEDPPSFETYDLFEDDNDDDDADFGMNDGDGDDDDTSRSRSGSGSKNNDAVEEKWSKSFRSMIKWCLQKDPTKRPNCQELLNHEHFRPLQDDQVRKAYQERIKEEICDLIPNVGKDPGQQQQRQRQSQQTPSDIEGKQPVPIASSDVHIPVNEVSASLEAAPSGTTWIFSDGSQVVSSGSGIVGENTTESATKDEDDFFDTFERTTQGENFKHPSMNDVREDSTSKKNDLVAEKKEAKETASENDDKADLDAFMDQFEKETSGENFKCSS